jgi:gamma-glutamyltranspeptidase/glutathione hydrolase
MLWDSTVPLSPVHQGITRLSSVVSTSDYTFKYRADKPVVEATKFAYGQRATFGDPAFTANVTYLENSYLTDAVAAAARAKIVTGETFPVSYYNPSNYFPSREAGTSHLATADGTGMAVSLTTTVNLIWGSQVSK